MMQDDVPEKDVIVAVLLFCERNDPRQNAWNLHDRDIRAQVLAFKFDDHIQALVEKLWKRMGRIDRQGREHRVNALRKEVRKVLLLAFRHVGIGVKAEPLVFELRLELLAPATVLIIHHSAHALADGGKRLAGRQTVRACFKRVHLLLLFKARDAHLEEFVQIRADDTEELQSFEKRIRFLNRLIEDALVEFQPAQLAVDEIGAIRKFHPRIVRLPSARFKGRFLTFHLAGCRSFSLRCAYGFLRTIRLGLPSPTAC